MTESQLIGPNARKKLIQEEHNTKPNRATVTKEKEIKTAPQVHFKNQNRALSWRQIPVPFFRQYASHVKYSAFRSYLRGKHTHKADS